ncbi:MAG TPA: SemiSWEET transporter [Stellaceae bacterium]
MTLLGLAAGLCTTLAYLPQAIKAWRTRSTHDISSSMFVLMTTGVVLWLIYGLIERDLPIVAANTASLALTAMILYLKLRFG